MITTCRRAVPTADAVEGVEEGPGVAAEGEQCATHALTCSSWKASVDGLQ